MLRLPRRISPCLLLACVGCASEATFGIVLRPGTYARLAVLGDNPFVRIDNQGPGEVEVTFVRSTGGADTTRLPTASTARNMRDGGTVCMSLANDATADLYVLVQDATGTALDYADRDRAPR